MKYDSLKLSNFDGFKKFKKNKKKFVNKKNILLDNEINNNNEFKMNNNIKENNIIKTSTKIVKKRNPGIDLLRLICMFFVIMDHLFNRGKGLKKYYYHKKKLQIIEGSVFWHNDGFALISGIIGYKSNKYSNLFYLWFYVFFYSVSITFYIQKFKPYLINKDDLTQFYFPMIFSRYWYFTSYFGMYLLLPVINKGITILTKSELKLVVISIIGIFVFWRGYKNPNKDIFHLNGGFSVLWLLTLYITGAYIGKHRVDYTGIKKFIFCLNCIFLFGFSVYLYYISNNMELYDRNGYYREKIFKLIRQMVTKNYDSMIKVMESISIALFLLQIKYNKYISIIISFLARVAFGIYLIHVNPIIFTRVIPSIFNNEPNNLTLFSTIILFLGKASKIFFLCIFIDYIRLLLFNILRIRKICIVLEQLLWKILG